jgi:hypothetical protein
VRTGGPVVFLRILSALLRLKIGTGGHLIQGCVAMTCGKKNDPVLLF